ncbi:unnamed protein product [Clonostachys byssicola]|uniref:Uncharacterized protein n=1 Tax=Clonostachys byssicola TaxID=160290 RepID=A0A9N9Y267_9HYPO|nr:unnamed protein product [Clonostachys byssicola]
MMAASNDQAPNIRADALSIEKEPYTDMWLFRWLTEAPGEIQDENGMQHQYRGYSIAPPRIQINRIWEMIRNHARDPVSDWKAKIFDCFRYLVSLDQEENAHRSWYNMLQVTIYQIKPIILIIQYENEMNQAYLHSPAVISRTNRFDHLLDPNRPLLAPPTPKRGSITELPHGTVNIEDVLKLPRFPSNLEEEERQWTLTGINKCYMEQEESRASSKRDRVIQEYRESLTESDKGEPVMPLPRNWNGPVELSTMDEQIKQTRDTLREHQKLWAQLEKSHGRWRNRPLINQILNMIWDGREGVSWAELDLEFGDHEFLLGSDGGRELRLIAAEEASWLWYLSRPLYCGDLPQTDGQCDRKFDVFWKRVRSWLSNYATCPRTFHTNQGFLSKQELMQQFNTELRGPVEKWRLGQMPPEVWKDADTRGVLEGSQYHTHYAVRAYYPERTIRWPSPPQEASSDGEVDGWEAYKRLLSQVEDEIITAEEMDRQVAQDAENGTSIVADQEKQTATFFRRLAYRLGYTIRVLSEEHHQDMETLESEGREEASRQSLIKVLDTWKRTRDQEDDTSQEGSRKRRCTSYRDIVREHVPDRFRKDWEDDHSRDVEAQCAKIVGQEVLWELEDKQPCSQEPCNKKGYREALWTFGHSSMKPRAKKFWDIDRWIAHQHMREQRDAGEQTNAAEHAGFNEVESMFYGYHYRPEQERGPDDRFYTDSASRSLLGPGAHTWQSEADFRPEIFDAEEVDGQQPQGDGEDDPPVERGSWFETVMGPQDTESGHSQQSEQIQQSETGTEHSGRSNKENVGHRTLLPSPDGSTIQGGIAEAGGPLQDVTHIHEPGAESEPDQYGRSEDENQGPRVRDQHSSFSIFEDGSDE